MRGRAQAPSPLLTKEGDMRKIEITMEKVLRQAREFEVTDEQFEEIKRTGRIPDKLFDEMESILDETSSDVEYEYDYAVADEAGRSVIEWG